MRPILFTLLCSCIVIATKNQLQECVDNLVGLIGTGKNWLHLTGNPKEEVYFPKLKDVTSRVLQVPSLIPEEEMNYDAMLVTLQNLKALKIYHIRFYPGCKLHMKVHGVVVVIFYGPGNLGNVFKEFWQCRFANVLVIHDLEVYTYHVVSRGNWTSTKPVALGKCSLLKSFEKESEVLLFKNCRLNIGSNLNQPYTNEEPYETNTGIDVAIIRIVMEKLQIIPNFVCTCKPTNNFRHDLDYEYDIDLGGFRLRYNNPTYCQDVYIQDQIVMSIFTQMAKPLPPWKQTLYIYDLETWLAILVSLLAMSCVSYVIDKRLGLIYAYSVLFLNDCTTPIRVKPLFLMWGFFAMLLTGLYGGLLVSYMCKLLLERQLLTFDEIKAAGYEYGLTWEEAIILMDVLKEKYLMIKSTKCNIDGLNCYQGLVQGNFAWITSAHKLLYRVSLNPTHVWFKLPNILVSYTKFDVMLSSPIIPRMEDIVQHLAEAGIINKIDKYQWKPMKNDNDESFTVVTLDHMYFIFVLFAIGILIAIITFLLEVVGRKFSEKRARPFKKSKCNGRTNKSL